MEHWSGSWRAYQGRETSESVDGDDDTAREAHSWSGHDDVDEMRMQEMEARVNIFAHRQSTKDSFLDVIRGLSWCCGQDSSESSKKTVLGSTEDIVEALK